MLTKNQLKILAIVCMTVDHIGSAFFPDAAALRIIGRLAFPIFSYCIAEGCRFTHDKVRYLGGVLGCGLLCVIAFLPVGGFYGNALLTMSMSIVLLYAVQAWENSGKCRFLALTAVLAGAFYLLCRVFPVDYGFAGVLLPLYAEAGRLLWERVLTGIPPVIGERMGFALGLLVLAAVMGGVQPWCLLALVPIGLLGTERDKRRMKNFFYIYYPAHLAVIGAVQLALEALAG